MKTIEAQLNKYSERTNNVLKNIFDSISLQKTDLIRAMEYSTLSGGKRIRPFIVYSVGEMLNVDINRLDIVAAAIECIHTYSLIHDDLPAMDNATFRRGKLTNHLQFNEALAILAGDALQTLAFEIIANSRLIPPNMRLKIILELAQAAGVNGMCEGQSADLIAEKNVISVTELEKIHYKKTGALIVAAAKVGVFASDYMAILPRLERYASQLGLAFQIQDDILDLTGSTELTGKDHMHDQALQKNTFPTLIGLNESKNKLNSVINSAKDALSNLKGYDPSKLLMLADYIRLREK